MSRERPLLQPLGYERDENGGCRLRSVSLTGTVARSRGRFANSLTQLCLGLTETLSYTSMRFWGLLMLGFGMLSVLLHYANDYLNGVPVSTSVIVLSIALSALGLLFSFFDKPIAIAFQDFELTDYIFFEFFCIKRMHRAGSARVIKPIFGLVIGFMLAAFGVIVPMWTIVLVFGVFLYLFLTFLTPEFSYFAIFLIMPYLPVIPVSEWILAGLVLTTLISFIIKVALGKRVYNLEAYDVLIGLFLVLILISGIFVKGIESFEGSLVILLFAMGYVLTSSMVSNRRLAEGVINAVVISAMPVAAFAVYQSVCEILAGGIGAFSGVSGTFNRPTDLAAYLLVAAAFSVYFATVRKRAGRVAYILVLVLLLLGMEATMCAWAFVCALLGLFAYGAARLRRGSSVLIFLIALLPSVLVFMSGDVLRFLDNVPVISTLSLGEFGERWQHSLAMLRDNLWLGVGMGSDSFSVEYAGYTDGTVYSDSGNLFLEIGCEAGVLALAAFLLLFIFRLSHRSVYRRYLRDARLDRMCACVTAALVILLSFGALNYLWSDMISNYLFWCVFAIGSPVMRIARADHDAMTAYYSDERSFDSSSVDISLV